jgi:CRP/FNR family transcriptional regulator, dissimilatory nitrate respiration regulator
MDYLFLSQTPLFRGTEADEVKKMLACLCAVEKHFEKGSLILHAGDTVESFGLVLTGSVNIESFDFDGRKSIIGHAGPGQLFAETYACVPNEPLMVNVTAEESTDILFLNAKQMLITCKHTCEYHTKLIRNLLSISAQKNLNLSRRILHTSPKSIRERLEFYLAYESKRAGSKEFTIPFDRQQLADYLNVDRSALSHEIGKMQKEGLIDYIKNSFSLLN